MIGTSTVSVIKHLTGIFTYNYINNIQYKIAYNILNAHLFLPPFGTDASRGTPSGVIATLFSTIVFGFLAPKRVTVSERLGGVLSSEAALRATSQYGGSPSLSQL